MTMSGVTGHAHGKLPCSSAKSAPENAAITPGMPRAALTSTEVIRACANGLRTKAMCSIPGRVRLSVQVVWPVTSRASSLRGRGVPNSVPAFSAAAWASAPVVVVIVPSPRLGRAPHGAHDVLVSGAAAEVALKPVPDLLVRGVRIVPEQVDGGQDHAGSAVAALQRVLGVERLLHWVPLAVGEALDGGDAASIRLNGQDGAALDRGPVHQHGAGTAVGGIAPDGGAGLADGFSQVMNKQQTGLDVVFVSDSVDVDGDPGH